jgi:hypothetical protein
MMGVIVGVGVSSSGVGEVEACSETAREREHPDTPNNKAISPKLIRRFMTPKISAKQPSGTEPVHASSQTVVAFAKYVNLKLARLNSCGERAASVTFPLRISTHSNTPPSPSLINSLGAFAA